MSRIFLSCLFFALTVNCFTQNDFLFEESKTKIELLNISTDEAEFGPFVVGKLLYFSSSQERKIGVINMETSTQHQMLDLYVTQLSDDSHAGKPKPLNDIINNPLNQGSCFFDKITSKLYYSSDVKCEGYASKYKLAIYSSYFQNNVFQAPIAELILPDTFSASHPFVINKRLYFSSNMPGGKGKTDIYFTEKPNESWDNLKKWDNFTNCTFLNSEENEFFPFVINENEIYFSSNRPGGLGKLDLYKYSDFGNSPSIQNIGKPINSEFDDFGIYVDSIQETGYFSSNRFENQDDIYFYRQTWPSFTNCKDPIPEDYCYNLSEESSLDQVGAKGFYYEWLFGDGTKQKGLSVRHCFPGPGNYLINLNIIDSLTRSVFMSQATFDLKVDSITRLNINCLDTLLADKPFAINTDWTYLPDNKIEGYYFEIDKQRLRGNDIKYSFSKPGVYKVLLGVVTFNIKTKKKELLCTTKNIVVVDQAMWAGVEERKFNEELTKYSYRAFKTDSSSKMSLISDSDIEMYNKMGLNGEKLVNDIKNMLAAKPNKKEIVTSSLKPGENKFAYTASKLDTVMRLKEQNEVTFKVHFGTSKAKKDTSYLSSKGLKGIAESLINEEYHYTYGNEKQINEIEKYYQRSIKAGVKNPVVIGYKNDKIIFDQSANIHPATFEESKFNAFKDSLLATSPQNYIGNNNEDPLTNSTANTTIASSDSQKNNTTSENNTEKTKNNELVNTTEKNSDKANIAKNNAANKTTKGSNKTESNNISSTNTNEATTSSTNETSNKNETVKNNTNEVGNNNSLTNVQKKMEYYLQKYGDVNVKDLEFKVQVGAFRKRTSYRFPKLARLGRIENKQNPDGITRMTIGDSFNKLSDAISFTKKVIQAGHEDAFVAVYYKGQRVYIENLERRGVFSSGGETTSEPNNNETKTEEPNYIPNENNNIPTTTEFEARTNIQKKIVMFAEKYGNISAEGLEFKVQIAVFKYRKTYNFPQLKNLGSINVEILNEGGARITIGPSFKTLNEAFELNKKVVIAGQTDAFVSVFYQGQRIYIENLERKGVFVVNKNK